MTANHRNSSAVDRIDELEGFPSDAVTARYPVYTRGNVGEVLPHALSPLMVSVSAVMDEAQRDALEQMGVMQRSELGDGRVVYPCFNGYLYLNLSVFRVVALRMGITTELMDNAIVHHPNTPPHRPSPSDDDPDAAARMATTVAWAMSVRELPEVEVADAEVDELRRTRPVLESLETSELVVRFRSIIARMREAWARHLYISFTSAIPGGAVMMLTGTATLTEDMLSVDGGQGGVVSAAPSYGLWDLGRQVAASTTLTAAFDAVQPHELLERLRALDDEDARRFLDALSSFTLEFGYRGVNEAEIGADTWETDPQSVLTLVERLRGAPASQSPSARREASARMAAEARTRLCAPFASDPAMLDMMEAAIDAALLLEAGRERTKATAIKLTHEARVVMRELGRRLLDAGHVDSVGDVTMVRDDELDDFLANPASYRGRIATRRENHTRLTALIPPFVIDGSVPPLTTWPPRDQPRAPQLSSGDVLEGIPGSAGVARGAARIVTDISQAVDLEAGDVLIAPFTDAAWTPLFLSAAAVVVDMGGSVSHAVVVAREFGIPCVVSASNASRLIPQGAMVQVDGTNGLITIL